MNTITIQLCQEDRDRLDKILAALATKNCASCVDSVSRYFHDTQAQTAAPVEPEAEPVPEHPIEEEIPFPEPEPENKIEHAAVQKKVVDLSTSGKRDAVKAIVHSYAEKVTAIPEDKLPEVWAQLIALEG